MADEQLVVLLEARIRDFERNLQRASGTAGREFRRMEADAKRSATTLERTFSDTGRRMGESLTGALRSTTALVSGALGIDQLRRYADGWTEARNKIAAAGEETSRLASRQSQLADLAIRSRADFSATIDLYSGLSRAAQNLGANQAQVLRVTETITKAFTVGGQSASTAAGAITQLNQAFAAGALRGDELNSLLEGAPPLARLIAQEFGVSTGELKRLGEEGALTADRVFNAILKGSASIEAEFARTNSTISQSFTNLSTAITRYVGELDQAQGASAGIAGAINGIANNADMALPIIATLGAALAGMFVGGPIGAGIAATGTAFVLLGDSIRPISGDLATIVDYGATAFELLRSGAIGASDALSSSFQGAADAITDALSGVGGDLGSVLSVVQDVANAIIGAFVGAAEGILAAWNGLGFALAETMTNAMNSAIAAVEKAVNAIVSGLNRVLEFANATGEKVGLNPGFGQVGAVSLGRVGVAYEGSTAKLAKDVVEASRAPLRDYVGAALDGANRFRQSANSRADDRAETSRRQNQLAASRGSVDDGSLDQRLRAPAATRAGGGGSRGGGGGSGGGGSSRGGFDNEVAQLEQRIAKLDQERLAVGRSAAEATRAETAFRLLEAAKQSGMPITDQLRAKVDSLADAYTTAKGALDQAQASQKAWEGTQQFIGTNLSSFFSDIISGGKNASEALMNLVKRLADAALQAALLGQGPLAGLFGGGGGGAGGGVGGIIGLLFGGLGFADGGYVSGPGTSRSDSIPARLSDGEFVINARATSQNRELLEAINSGRVARFADGGLVGGSSFAPSGMSARPTGDNQMITIAPSVTVNASGGTPEQNADLASQTAKQVEGVVRDLVVKELMIQRRQGNMLSR